MKCARCLEDITVPYFFEGKTFGYTCIKIVNPLAKKKKASIKEHWVVADSHDYAANGKQLVTAVYNGKKHHSWAVSNVAGEMVFVDSYMQLGANGEVYINIAAFTWYWKAKQKIES